MLIENVPEFVRWGPLGRDGKPLKSRRGEIFRAFLAALQSLGYKVEYRVLNAANYGDATTRERLFIMARKGRKAIHWPEPTHTRDAKTKLWGRTKRWRSAREIIDWEIQSQSIFERQRPLKPNTLNRIYAGLQKFSGLPFIVPQHAGGRVRDTSEPLPTIVGSGTGYGLCEPFIIGAGGPVGGGQPRSVNEPLRTVNHGVEQGERDGHRRRIHDVDQPVPTITTTKGLGLVEPFLVRYNGNHKGKRDGDRRIKSVDEPLSTLDTSNRLGLCQPFLIKY